MDEVAGPLGFQDIEAAVNMRDWLQRACERHGAKVVGGGLGCGQADIEVMIDGCRFDVSIRPQIR